MKLTTSSKSDRPGTMTSIRELWSGIASVGERGGATRLDGHGAHDFYASIDVQGRPGLVLISLVEPPKAPAFDAFEVTAVQRPDERWLLSIWLKDASLADIFGELCQRLVEASVGVEAAYLPVFIVSRLLDWQRLLEGGASELLGPNVLRGLVGELIVLRDCLRIWQAEEIIQGWTGPFHAPQDFALPGLFIEAKAISRSATTVRINSLEQLEVPPKAELRLAVAVVTSVIAGTSAGFSPLSLVNEIRDALRPEPQTLRQFDNRLKSAGFEDHQEYGEIAFRCDSLRFYNVGKTFPRIVRSELSLGISKVMYDVSIASFADAEVANGRVA